MTEIRCKKCNRMLFKTNTDPWKDDSDEGPYKRAYTGEWIEIKCGKCGYMNKYSK
jgi:phage FluMu protein Com